MARGRPPTPIEKMKARSPDGRTPGHRKVKDLVPVSPTTPQKAIPELPAGVTGRGVTEWEKIWAAGFWLKRDQDYHWVEMIVRAYGDIEVYRCEVQQMGLTVTGYAGQTVANPLLNEIRKLEQTIQKCLQVLGFSPTDRAKLAIQEEKAQNAVQRMIDKQNEKR